ncbi:MAG: hypothetical protein R3F11_15045 [Verrucomicrobiales bacterium]
MVATRCTATSISASKRTSSRGRSTPDRYVGHNLHVEFVAADGAALEIPYGSPLLTTNIDLEFIARPPQPELLALAAKPVASMNDFRRALRRRMSAQTPAFADLIARNAGAFDQNGAVAKAVADHAAARAALSAKIQRERPAPFVLGRHRPG